MSSALPEIRLQVEGKEGMKDVVGEEGDEQEAFDGAGVMFENMIGMPLVDQFVEAMVFDVPTLVPETDDPLGGNLGG